MINSKVYEDSAIDGYLRYLGVNQNVITYIKENKIFLNKHFENILGKDFFMLNDEQHKKEHIEKLKIGSDELKIFDNGAIWFSTTQNPKGETNASFALDAGFMSISADKEYDQIKTNNYISFENGMIKKRTIQQKRKTKDNQIYYDGSISEEIKNINSTEKTTKNASFHNSKTAIPKETLETKVEKRNNFGFATEMKWEQVNYSNSLWYLVSNGEVKNQKIIENLNLRSLSTKDKFKLVMKNIFTKSKTKNQTELFGQLRDLCIESLENENLNEIIHCEFSIKGADEKICSLVLEKVTESSRDIIFQSEFQNTEQFRKQILEPLLVVFAQTNSIIRGKINPNNTGSFQYRAISTNNNALTVNNISKEYANYIAENLKVVEPYIYNQKMEQKEKQLQQQENEKIAGYQKVNKKSKGFLNVLLLDAIVGFYSGLILYIMLKILINN